MYDLYIYIIYNNIETTWRSGAQGLKPTICIICNIHMIAYYKNRDNPEERGGGS